MDRNLETMARLRWFLLAVGVVAGLSACAPAQEALDEATRKRAKDVVTPIVEQNFPGTNATIVSDCVIDNASTGEILTIARASVTGVDAETLTTVTEIIGRPETLNCVIGSGVFLVPEQAG